MQTVTTVKHIRHSEVTNELHYLPKYALFLQATQHITH